MQPDYFDTHFKLDLPNEELPEEFAIVTAYQPTGTKWPDERNAEANLRLKQELEQQGVLQGKATGYSPRTGHAEPGFAANISFEEACDLGLRFEQDAIYFVSSGTIFVSHCDHRRSLIPVARFLERVDPSC